MISKNILNFLTSFGPDLNITQRFSWSWICNWTTVTTSYQQNNLTSNIKHDDNSTQSKNTVITCTAAWEHLFALTPNMMNQWSNFIQSVIQRYWLLKWNKTKILASSLLNFLWFDLGTGNKDAYLKCNGVKVSIFCGKCSKVKVYRNRNREVQISKKNYLSTVIKYFYFVNIKHWFWD